MAVLGDRVRPTARVRPATLPTAPTTACSVVVHHAPRRTRARAAISSRAVSSRRANWAADSVPRRRSRRASSSNDGGSRNTVTASGSAALIARAPCRSTSTSTGRPAASASLDRLPRGAGALQAAVDLGPLQQLAALDQPVEPGRADEAVVAPVDLTGTRVPGGGRHAEVQLGQLPRAARRPRCSSRRRRGRPGRSAGPSGPSATAPVLTRRRSRPAAPCAAGRRARAAGGYGAISSRSMIWRRGPCRRPAWPRAAPRPSSCRAPRRCRTASRTSPRVVPPRLSRSFSSARARRAAAAFSNAAARCSSVSWGRATVSSVFRRAALEPGRIVTTRGPARRILRTYSADRGRETGVPPVGSLAHPPGWVIPRGEL